MQYRHTLAEHSFADQHATDSPLDCSLDTLSFNSEDRQRWVLQAVKVFSEGSLLDANVVGADISDFKVKIGEPGDAQWDGIRKYIYDNEHVGAPNVPAQVDPTFKTVDLEVLLLKGNDQQIRAVMKGAYYDETTVFHADKNFNKLIHGRLNDISTGVNRDELKNAAYDYEGLRQESVPIADKFRQGALFEEFEGGVMGDGKTLISEQAHVPASEFVGLHEDVDLETVMSDELFDTINRLASDYNNIESLAVTYLDLAERDVRLQEMVEDPTATYEKRSEFQTQLTIEPVRGYQRYYEARVQDEGVAKDEQKERLKALRNAGPAIVETAVQPGVLTITGVLLNQTAAFVNAQGGVETQEAQDYFTARDKQGRKFLVPVDGEACPEIVVVKGDKVRYDSEGWTANERGLRYMDLFRGIGHKLKPNSAQIDEQFLGEPTKIE
jgi:hypothetical protein